MVKNDEKLTIITEACDDKNGVDIEVINIKNRTSVADYFVIVSGNSTIQTKTIANEVEFKMAEAGYGFKHKEGHDTGRWILLDYGDIIVHVFHREEREYYKLERLWTEVIEEEI